jgi:hypothetical protein
MASLGEGVVEETEGVFFERLQVAPVSADFVVVEQTVDEVALLLAHGVDSFGDDPVEDSGVAGRDGGRAEVGPVVEGLCVVEHV